MKFFKTVLTCGILFSLFGCSMQNIPFMGEEKGDIIQKKSEVIKGEEKIKKNTETKKEKNKKNISKKILKEETLEVPEEKFHESAPTIIQNQTPALLNRYKDMIEENSMLIAMQNNQHSIALLERQEIAILQLIKEISSEIGKDEEEIDIIYEKFIQTIFENIKQMERINIYLHLDPNTIADLIQKQKLVKNLGLENFFKDTSKNIPEGLCFALSIKSSSEELKKNLGGINGLIQSQIKKEKFDANIDINTEEGIYKTQIGCKNESIPTFEKLPKNSNIILIENGKIVKNLELLKELSENNNSKQNKILTKLDDIINKLNSELNSHLITNDRQSIISIFSILKDGYKTQILESYSDKNYRNIRKDFFTGEALIEEFFMNKNTIHKSSIQTPNNQNRFEIYVENSFENIDWTHWIGRLEKSGLNATMIIPILGIGSTVAITTFGEYKEKAQTTKRIADINMIDIALKTARAIDSIKNFHIKKEKVLETIQNEVGFTVPIENDNHCIFYASHPKATNEFLVFSDGKNRIFMRGTKKAKKAISGFFSKNNIETINCEAPKLPGFEVSNLSQ